MSKSKSKNSKTLAQQILAIARRRSRNGITVSELADKDLRVQKMTTDGIPFDAFAPDSSVRARVYEMANNGVLVAGDKRNGATVFRLNRSYAISAS